MIETTYIHINEAAEKLGTDVDKLLVAAIERRIQLYGLLNKSVEAELWKPTNSDHCDYKDDEATCTTITKKIAYFNFVPLDATSIGDALHDGLVPVKMLSDRGDYGEFWVHCSTEILGVPRNQIYAKDTHIQAALSQKRLPDQEFIQPNSPTEKSHRSQRLQYLLQASDRYWANATENEKSSQPKNSDVANWLTGKEFSPSLAKHAASIIRPEWAHQGRQPEE